MEFELLCKFFDGLTSEEENRCIKAWLEAGPDNKKRFFAERKIYDAIVLHRKEPEVQIAPAPGKKVKGLRLRLPAFAREMMKIAAVVSVTLLGYWYLLADSPAGSEAMQTIHVPAGQRLNLILPDGTDVWLNAKTTISYPVTFNSKERLVTIDGQAYFDVAKNEKLPFIVKTPQGVVQALGTKFDVLDYSDSGGDNDFQTMLMEGSVKVHLLDKASEPVVLNPEEKAFFDRGNLKVTQVYDQSAYQWKEGLISFRNETFEDIMRYFEKTYDIKVVIENTQIGSVAYTGKFRMIDGVEYALRVLQRNVKFEFDRDVDSQIIYIK